MGGYVMGNARRTRFKKILLISRTPSGPTVETVGYVMGNARRTRFKKILLISRTPSGPTVETVGYVMMLPKKTFLRNPSTLQNT